MLKEHCTETKRLSSLNKSKLDGDLAHLDVDWTDCTFLFGNDVGEQKNMYYGRELIMKDSEKYIIL